MNILNRNHNLTLKVKGIRRLRLGIRGRLRTKIYFELI